MAPTSLLTRNKKSRKKNKTETPSIEVVALYQQDLGTAGIKKKRQSEQVMTTVNAFLLPMTKEEKKKRRKRKVRTSRSQHVSWFVPCFVANPVLAHFDSSFDCRQDLRVRGTKRITRSSQNQILYTLHFQLLGRLVRK
jgi:hypothetical protein